MSKTPATPRLTPQFCFNQTALRDFLRLSRAALDDRIVNHLNGLPPTPSTSSPTSCESFTTSILLPLWHTRSTLLTYCAHIATSPDPNDPEASARLVETASAQSRLIDERLDPYSARYTPREARTEALAALVRNERAVEGIIRARTWGAVVERCGEEKGGVGMGRWEGKGAEEALEEWRGSMGRGG